MSVSPASPLAPQRPLRLDVALTPRASTRRPNPPYTNAPRDETVYIVVDVIRATTSLCVLFERDCAAVLVAPDVAAAHALGQEIDRSIDPAYGPRVLLAGEVGGARPDGFDFGNSPTELSHAPVKSRIVLFATTNGTRAIRACAGGRAILAGALRNAQAVANAALAAVPEHPAPPSPVSDDTDEAERFDIVIVCSGRDDQPAYDDTICAGFILRRLMDAAPARGRAVALESGAQNALATLAGVEARGGIRAALAQSGAYRAIQRIGLAADLDWCAAIDVTTVVPRVTGSFRGHDLIEMTALSISEPG